jgi:hypothetical protein
MELQMTEEEKFKKIVNEAINNRSDSAPEFPQEFDVYADMHYNLYMFIKNEWINVGLNVTPTDKII